VLALLLLNTIFMVRAETIEVGVLTATAIQKKVYVKHVEKFKAENPGIDVQLVFKTDSEFKKSFSKWLADGKGPSILSWQGGNRLYQVVQKEQVLDLSNFFAKYNLLPQFNRTTIDAASYTGRQYGLPLSYYHWGFYYRESVFENLNLTAPNTWEEFVLVCQKLKDAGITPITLGSKFNWPVAAWFDYLNLRINGLMFHQSLLQGQESFDDPRVVDVLAKWKRLIDAGFFIEHHSKLEWLEAMPYLYHQKAGMTLIGNFFTSSVPQALGDDFRFFRFPIVNDEMKVYEEAPLDLLIVPAYANLTSTVEKLLLLFASKEVQEELNEVSGMISPNILARAPTDYFIQQGKQTLDNAAGFSQFFDRDTTEEMSSAAMPILNQFLQNADIEKTVEALERARKEHLSGSHQ
jgi:multiple sugar transport system substrate-binding protein